MVNIIENISLYINNQEIIPVIEKLTNDGKNFHVSQRYRVIVPLCTKNRYINAELIITNNVKFSNVGLETGEDLYAVSYYWDNNKMTIGTLGDLPQIHYDFTSYSISVSGLYPKTNLIFYLAYVNDINVYTELSTWLAVDPDIS